jgi:ATP-dependent Lhr-like helicase
MTFARWPSAEVVLVLGGRSWRVTHLEWESRVAYVTPTEDQGRSRWAGAGQPIRYELCQAMRDVLFGCDLPAAVSNRAVAALDDLRQDFKWMEAGSTALVRSADASRWWTFGGLYANASLAAGLKAKGISATPNNLAIRFPDAPSGADLSAAIRAVREMPPDALLPEVSQKAIEGLKFNACLPPALATRVLHARMADWEAVHAVLGERCQLVDSQTADE